jgi:glucosamine--fructose-6-phosphate aminotransferase (isomerizing)
MCGIFGYKWNSDAKDILLTWLKRLEYRGYDSAGLSVGNSKTKDIVVIKSVWKVHNLIEKVDKTIYNKFFNYWIAHTRWATHWKVNLENTHPHYDDNKNFILVHNWIIENFNELRNFLVSKWYNFYSETDTEVVAKLLDFCYDWNFVSTVKKVLEKIEWAYAFLIISRKFPWEIIWTKFGSPLIFWYGKNWLFFSSDVQALSWYVDNVIYLDDWDLVYVRWNKFSIKSEWKLVHKPIHRIDINSFDIEKWEYPHYMLKEIFEQPEVLRRVLNWIVDLNNYEIISDSFRQLEKFNIERVVFIACWTSYNAWLLWARWLENLAWIDAKAEIASEFLNKNFKVDDNTLFVFISQSWETADTIEALKLVKSKWWKTFGIVNVVWSTISRLTDYGIFTRAWVEIGVASTKAFISQLAVLLLLILHFGIKNSLSYSFYKWILDDLKLLPLKIEEILSKRDQIKQIANKLINYKNFFFLWRAYQLPIAYESSLKFKEITYLHSEAYPAGELKHGPLALIDEYIPTIIFAPDDWLLKENISSIQEIKARKWKVLLIWNERVKEVDWFFKIPKINDILYPFLTVVVWQLLAYYVADKLDREIDKPRNLAKSVTVK